MESKNPILQVNGLKKVFTTRSWFTRKIKKEFVAVNKISFDIQKGEILGLLGANGAGKTTTIQMLLGTLTPSGGSILYFGKEFATHRSEILQQVGFASAYSKLPGKLTVYENLDVFARLYGIPYRERQQRIAHLLEIFNIADLRNKLTRNLSAGQTTRAILAKAFLPNPEIVLLDEPTASLDPDIAHDIRQFILQQQRERNISIIFTSHNMDEVAEVCDRVVVMKHGTIVAADTPARLAASISVTRIELIISEGLEACLMYVNSHNMIHAQEKNSIIIELDEAKVSELLASLASVGVRYSQISINKPTLEDYFIRLAKQ